MPLCVFLAFYPFSAQTRTAAGDLGHIASRQRRMK